MYPRHYLDYFRRFAREPHVFVAMPFADHFQPRWLRIFAPVARRIGLRAFRVDQSKTAASIQIDILEGIADAQLVLVDISSDQHGLRNPNVLYELGVAHACRLPEEVLVVRSDTERLPFDFAQMRVHHLPVDDFPAARDVLERLVRGALKDIDVMRDRILAQTLRSLDPDARMVLRFESSKDRIPSYQAQHGSYAHLTWAEVRAALHRLVQAQALEVNGAGPGGEYYSVTALGRAVARAIT